MTRDEFADWLEEVLPDALDNCPQSDASPQKWAARLQASLKELAEADEASLDEEEEAEPEDEPEEDEDSEDEEEEPEVEA